LHDQASWILEARPPRGYAGQAQNIPRSPYDDIKLS
jgi:hypothetical protein